MNTKTKSKKHTKANKDDNIIGKKKTKATNPLPDQYESDSSDEEVLVRTGNVPTEWYDSYQHVGYSIDSKKVQKNKKEDEIEQFLKKANDKNWWRNIYDEKNNTSVFLSDKDLTLINRIRNNYFASKSAGKDDFFEKNIPYQKYALNNHRPSKQSFGLSKNERKMVNRLIYLYKNGLMPMEEPPKEEEKYYDIWEYTNESSLTQYYPGLGYQAPKRELPDTDISYNPPNNEKESILRKVPKYEKLIEEEMERCCDLFLNARTIKKKINLKESDIMPDLPKPEELRPFPTKETILFKGHSSSIKALCCDPNNLNVLISADNGNFIHFWDIKTAKIIVRFTLKEKVHMINYNKFLNLVVICTVSHIFFVLPAYLGKNQKENIMNMINEKIYPLIQNKENNNIQDNKDSNVTINDAFVWKIPKQNSTKSKNGIVFYMKWIQGTTKKIEWHSKGDYFATLSKNSQGKPQIYIHSLTKMTHQLPISKLHGNVNAISFHPTKPYFIVASNKIFIYNLQKQELVRSFISNLGMITHIAVHKNGSDLIAGSHDGKVAWFQLELSNKPWHSMDYHKDKMKSLEYHKEFPLFFSCARNGSLVVYYSKVTEEELTDPLVVPLKDLKATHTSNQSYGCACFHPKQPWIFSGGRDGIIRLWTEKNY
jgi:ribosome biogenesis protein ERB1